MEISKLIGISKPRLKYVEDRKGHDFRYAIESLYYKRNFDLQNHEDALKDTIQFYMAKYEV